MTDELNLFLSEAQKRFGLFNDEEPKDNPLYISVPGWESQDLRIDINDASKRSHDLLDPALFLSGIEREDQSELDKHLNQTVAEPPFVCMIVGQYGIGKTEFVVALCRRLLQGRDKPKPLPIKLVTCRHLMPSDRDKLNETDFATLLFSSTMSGLNIKADFISEILLPKIIAGEIYLILDGMDELFQDRYQHTWFLESLGRILNSGSDPSEGRRFRVVCTMREELLSMVSSRDAGNFKQLLKKYAGDHEFALYFLGLTFFQKAHILSYLRRRLNAGNEPRNLRELLEKVIDTQDSPFLHMLGRPLLLRLLADWAELTAAKMEDLKKFNAHPLYVLKLYIETATEDPQLRAAQNEIVSCHWDIEKIANKCFSMYEKRRVEMYPNDIIDIVTRIPEGLELKESEALASIHKCPFLSITYHSDSSDYDAAYEGGQPAPIKDIADHPGRASHSAVIYFSHKIFYEYFTATGMWEDKRLKDKDDLEFRGFDELVLNVDMRKFLKELVGNDWYDYTRLSYALNKKHWPQWKFKDVGGPDGFDLADPETYDHLENQRQTLLNLMTNPEEYTGSAEEQLKTVIHQFLDEEAKYHPRYLIFNYEAVTVYVWRQFTKTEGEEIDKRFNDALHRRCNSIVNGLREGNFSRELIKPWELLLHQTLDNAARLSLPWLDEYKDQNYGDSICQTVRDESVRARLEGVFSDIREMYS